MTLDDQIADAEAKVEQLKARKAGAPCSTAGCDMKFYGGANAGCGEGCGCSVSVHVCTRCGDSDYGDNDEAHRIRAECAERNSE